MDEADRAAPEIERLLSEQLRAAQVPVRSYACEVCRAVILPSSKIKRWCLECIDYV